MSALPPWLASTWAALAAQLDAQRVHHALLIGAPRGLGKRALAEAWVASLLCLDRRADGHACGRCRGCTLRLGGTHPDFIRIALADDATQITIDQIRDLEARIVLAPTPGGRRVALIDRADELNFNAANALLKTLEEPPGSGVIVLVSDAPERLIATIRSRCQRVRITLPEAASAKVWLIASGVAADEVDAVLAMADGNPGIALELAAAETRALRDDTIAGFIAVHSVEAAAFEVAARWAKDRAPLRLEVLARALAASVRGQHLGGTSTGKLDGVTANADLDRIALDWIELNRLRQLIKAPVRGDLVIAEWLTGSRRAYATRAAIAGA